VEERKREMKNGFWSKRLERQKEGAKRNRQNNSPFHLGGQRLLDILFDTAKQVRVQLLVQLLDLRFLLQLRVRCLESL